MLYHLKIEDFNLANNSINGPAYESAEPITTNQGQAKHLVTSTN